jgi:hypothetical protein
MSACAWDQYSVDGANLMWERPNVARRDREHRVRAAGEKDALRLCRQAELLRVGVEGAAVRVIDVDVGLIRAVQHTLLDAAIERAIDNLPCILSVRNDRDHFDRCARDDPDELHPARDRIKDSRCGHATFLSVIELGIVPSVIESKLLLAGS